MRRSHSLIATGLLLSATAGVQGQSRATLDQDAGSSVTVNATVGATTTGGISLSDSDSDTASVTGDAVLTLLPDAATADTAVLHRFTLDVDTITLSFCFVQFLGCVSGANITITDLHTETLSVGDGPVAAGGAVAFNGVVTHATGTATVVGTGLLEGEIDQIIPIDVSTTGNITAHLEVIAGTVTLDGFSLPPTSASVPPEDLPAGFSAVTVDLVVNAANVSLSGPHAPALFGDADADGDVDLQDHAVFVDCLTGPLGTATPPCTLVDWDIDDDVDLVDFAALQELLAPSR